MSNTEKKEKRKREVYNAKLYEFQEANKKSLCISNIFSVVITVGCAIGTLIILNSETVKCQNSNLWITLYLMLGMHAINTLEGVCGLTGLDKIFCGCCCVVIFFAYEVGVLLYMQITLYANTHCAKETPTQYWWLLANNVVYIILFIALIILKIRGLCAAPTKEEIE